MKSIGEVIAKHRRKLHYSQKELATLLEEHGHKVLQASISAWEKGKSNPHAEVLLALFEILKIHDPYGEFIGENPDDPLRNLNDSGKRKVLEYVRLLELSDHFCKEQ